MVNDLEVPLSDLLVLDEVLKYGDVLDFRNADDGGAAAGVAQTLRQTTRLNGDDLVAAVVLFRFPVG